MQLAFLILNYKNLQDTLKCIESIKTLNLQDFVIVIVDNGSNDGSAEKISLLAQNDPVIKLVALENNLGFSAGNNAGYEYIRKNYDPEFLIVTNNDVLFPQPNLYSQLNEIYQKNKFHVFGPDIFVRANKEHQSPIMLDIPNYNDMKQELAMYEYYLSNPIKWAKRRKLQNKKNRLCQSNVLIDLLYNLIRNKKPIDRLCSYENVCIQGACIIVSNDFLKNEEKMFTPETFLYCEEILLFIKCKQKNYKILYDPKVQIYHEDSATMKKINHNDVERAKFTLKHHVNARKIVLECLKNL